MPPLDDIPSVAMQLSRDVLVASIQVDLSDAVLGRFRDDLLQRIHSGSCRGVVLDLSGLATLDAHEFDGLTRVAQMCKIMGARPVLVGMSPGIVSALIEANVDTGGLDVALTLDGAFDLLQPGESEVIDVSDDPEAAPPAEAAESDLG